MDAYDRCTNLSKKILPILLPSMVEAENFSDHPPIKLIHSLLLVQCRLLHPLPSHSLFFKVLLQRKYVQYVLGQITKSVPLTNLNTYSYNSKSEIEVNITNSSKIVLKTHPYSPTNSKRDCNYSNGIYTPLIFRCLNIIFILRSSGRSKKNLSKFEALRNIT